eukprot:3597938-Amphidinium_carterae.1
MASPHRAARCPVHTLSHSQKNRKETIAWGKIISIPSAGPTIKLRYQQTQVGPIVLESRLTCTFKDMALAINMQRCGSKHLPLCHRAYGLNASSKMVFYVLRRWLRLGARGCLEENFLQCEHEVTILYQNL